jgi:hypothetical protein
MPKCDDTDAQAKLANGATAIPMGRCRATDNDTDRCAAQVPPGAGRLERRIRVHLVATTRCLKFDVLAQPRPDLRDGSVRFPRL